MAFKKEAIFFIIIVVSLLVVAIHIQTPTGNAATLSKQMMEKLKKDNVLQRSIVLPKNIPSPRINTTRVIPQLSPKLGRTLEIALFCSDGILTRDRGETDVDCGGPCKPCVVGKRCKLAEDCESVSCKRREVTTPGESYREPYGTCIEPSCFDGVMNSDETGVDCGGSCEKRCTRCTDSDATENSTGSMYVQGTVIDITGRQERDTCTSQSGGKEAFCDTKGFAALQDFMCPPDTVCRDGRCAPQIVSTCNDPDAHDVDGGIHSLTTATDSLGGSIRDSCLNENTVHEAVCAADNNRVTSSDIPCPEDERCVGGICVPATICEQPNPQQYYPNSNVIRTDQGFHLNTCQDEHTVNTIVCRWGDVFVGQNTCETPCINGVCELQNICIDTDEGNNPAQEGHQFWNDGYSNNDYCQAWNILGQVDCGEDASDYRFFYNTERCPRNTICVMDHGICRPASTTCREETVDGIQRTRVTYVDQETGEEFNSTRENYCDPFREPEEGPQRPRNGWHSTCTTSTDSRRPQNARADHNESRLQCTEDEVCVNDTCVPYDPNMNLCDDSDGGFILEEQGTISGVVSPWSYTDYCIGNLGTRIREFSCGPEGLWKGEDVDCPPGTLCNNGACRECSDSDPENIASKRGTVRYATGDVQSDVCLPEGGNRLIQYNCGEQQGIFIEQETHCSGTCEEGECNPAEENPQPVQEVQEQEAHE